MKFHFKLETVLKLRMHEEKMEQQRLGLVLNEWQALKDKRYDLEQSLSRISGQFMQQSDMDIVTTRHFYGFIHDQHKILHELDHEMKITEQKVAEQRKKLLEANKQTRMLEKLKEKERINYIRENDRIEQVELNEIATQRFNQSN